MHRHQRYAASAAAGILLVTGVVASAPATATTSSAASAARSSQIAGTPLVLNARLGTHPTFDRIVIDSKGVLPDPTVRNVSTLRYDGSGDPVPLTGKYFLEISFFPANAHTEAGSPTYKGPRLVKPNLPKIKGFAFLGDFEGVVTFGAAFNTKPYYNLSQLHSPERFVIDIAR